MKSARSLFVGIAVCVVAGGFLGGLSTPVVAQDLHVALHERNHDYLEILLDARDVGEGTKIDAVKLEVVITRKDESEVPRSFVYYPRALDAGFYRTYIEHWQGWVTDVRGVRFSYELRTGTDVEIGTQEMLQSPPEVPEDIVTLAEKPALKPADPTFNILRIKEPGLKVDWCLKEGEGCGLDAANEYCRMIGYFRATVFEKAEDVGWAIRLGDKSFCEGPECTGFAWIECVR